MKFSKTVNSTKLLNDNTQGTLRSNFTPFGIWAFSIGTSIGWGSFIVTCSAYLQKAGILGTVFGLLIGMAVILVITRNLFYMINNSPDAGVIYTFEKRVGGDEFAVISQNEDYAHVDELLDKVTVHNATAIADNGIVIACGMAKYEGDPCVAQIIAVADTFDAMYSDRPYRDRMNYDKAIDIIRNASGTQLTPDVVDAFLRLAEKGEFRAENDRGGGSTEDISNIRKKQDEE